MKNLLFPLLTFIVIACKNPVEDFVLGFKEPIETGTLRIQFNLPEEGKVPADLKFSVTGPDAAQIVSHLNTPKYRINAEGVVVLALAPELEPTPEQPVDFTVVAEAAGYLKVIRRFRYTARTNRSFSARLIKAGQTGAMATRQLEIDDQAAVEVANGAEKLELHLPAGNRFFDENGQALSGTRELSLITYSAAGAQSRLPDGGTAAKPLNAGGKPLANPFTVSRVAGMVSIEMSTKNQEVIRSFKEPLQAVMQLNPNTLHPVTGKPIKAGDRLDIISYDTDEGVWKLEGETAVSKNAGGALVAEFPIPHLSYWIAGWIQEICAKGPSFRVSSDYTNLDISHLARLVNARDGSVIKEYYLSLNKGKTLNVSLLPAQDDPVKLVVLDYNNYHGGNKAKVLATSAAVPLCESRTVDLPAVRATLPKPLTIEMNNTCPNGSTIPDSKLPAQLRIQFSEVGKNAWKDAGVITRGAKTAVTYRLLIGRRYDLRGSTDGGVSWPYQTLNAHIDKAYWLADLKDLGYCK